MDVKTLVLFGVGFVAGYYVIAHHGKTGKVG